jgi:hypothetical protein
VLSAGKVLNMVVSSGINDDEALTPFECWYGFKPDVSRLRTIGCNAYAHLVDKKGSKVTPNAVKCRLIGHDTERKCYRLWRQENNTVVLSRDVAFDENTIEPITQAVPTDGEQIGSLLPLALFTTPTQGGSEGNVEEHMQPWLPVRDNLSAAVGEVSSTDVHGDSLEMVTPVSPDRLATPTTMAASPVREPPSSLVRSLTPVMTAAVTPTPAVRRSSRSNQGVPAADPGFNCLAYEEEALVAIRITEPSTYRAADYCGLCG